MEYASKTEAINGADNTKIMTPLRVKQSILANGQGGGVVEEADPIFKSSPAYNITQENINNWNNNTYTAGTGINISSDNVISNTITNTSQLNNDNNFINEIKTINGQSLIGQGDIIIECGIKEETDPVFTNSPASTITQNDIEKWNSFSGGDLSYDIKPPADYTTTDTDRISSIMLGDITPTTEDYAKYDLNGDGVIDILDLRICRSLIEYNLKSSVPGRIIIDASDYLKPIKIINSDNKIIASLGVNSNTRDLAVNGDLSVSKNINANNITASGNISAKTFQNMYACDSTGTTGSRWLRLCTIKRPTHSQGSFAFFRIHFGNGNNGRIDQNAFIDLTLQQGWTGENGGRYGGNYVLYPFKSSFNLSNVKLIVTSIDLYTYEVWFWTTSTYCRPSYSYDVDSGVTIEHDGTTFSTTEPTSTKCNISGESGSSNEVVLYDNETGSNATITLSETSANFKYLEIFCKSGDNTHTSVKVYKPDGKRATVVSGWFGSAAYFKLSVLTISGNTIALIKNASEITGSNRCNTGGNVNAMYITRVVGYRN